MLLAFAGKGKPTIKKAPDVLPKPDTDKKKSAYTLFPILVKFPVLPVADDPLPDALPTSGVKVPSS